MSLGDSLFHHAIQTIRAIRNIQAIRASCGRLLYIRAFVLRTPSSYEDNVNYKGGKRLMPVTEIFPKNSARLAFSSLNRLQRSTISLPENAYPHLRRADEQPSSNRLLAIGC
jgi:hypothetical protein